jgi:LysM repeat protein
MNRRQLTLIIVLNALISLAIALTVAWVFEARRPDPEELAARFTPAAAPQPAATFTPTAQSVAAGDATAQGDAAAPTATPAAATGEAEVYVVQAGDSLSTIADRFGVTIAAIVAANDLANPDFVFSGQRLVIPQAGAAPSAPVTPAAIVTEGIRLSVIDGGGDLTRESISVVNDSDLAVNLQGWKLEREGGAAYTFGSVLLFPGSGVLVYTGVGADTSVAVYWNQSEAVWQSGAQARLVNPQGDEVARLAAP